jgi:WhiB family redox-sensing transcriptional regulator
VISALSTWAIHQKHQGDKLQELTALLELPQFFAEARCVGKEPTVFDGENQKAIAEAKKICNTCPVRIECANWAIRTQEFGVWGSLTPEERRKKAKGMKVVDITGLRLLDDEFVKLTSNSPIAELASEFKVTTRTIHRWRKKIFATNKTLKRKSHDHKK